MLYSHLIPARIKELREKVGWSKAELARQLDVTRASINSWERGKAVPNTLYLVAMTRLFHVSADYLLGLENKPTIVLENYSEQELALVMNLIQYIDSQHHD